MFGTEGRRTDGKQIPALDKVFDFISYKGDDIRDMTVCEGPPPPQQQPHPQPQPQPQQDKDKQAYGSNGPEESPGQEKKDKPEQPETNTGASGVRFRGSSVISHPQSPLLTVPIPCYLDTGEPRRIRRRGRAISVLQSLHAQSLHGTIRMDWAGRTDGCESPAVPNAWSIWPIPTRSISDALSWSF